MTSTGLLQFLLAVGNPATYDVDGNDLSTSISAELVMDACHQLESDLRQSVCTQRELLWRAQTRIMSIAGPDITLSLSDSPERLAKLLLIFACKSKLKHKVIALIMKMGIGEQQQLMSIIKDAEMEVCRKESLETVSEPGMTEIISNNERLRSRLQVAESELCQWKCLFEEETSKVQVELTARNEECHRLKKLVATVQDELDIVKEQNNRMPALEQSIRRLEENLDETDDLRGNVRLLTSDLDRLKHLVTEKDCLINSLQARFKIVDENRDLLVKQESEIQGLTAEKEALTSSNNQLLEELNTALSCVRQYRQQLNQYQTKPLIVDGLLSQARPIDFLESEINELKEKLLASTKQSGIDKHEIKSLCDQLDFEKEKNASLLSRINSTEQKFAEISRVYSKLRKENESLHEMLTIDQGKARKGSNHAHDNDENSILNEVTNVISHAKLNDQNQSDLKKKDDVKKTSRNDEINGLDQGHCQQELQLMSSALHNLVIEYQRRFLSSSVLISSPTPANLPDSISIRSRNRFRSQSVKSMTLNGIP